MREISSKRYAMEVEDIICESLENALMSAFDLITKNLGCIEDYDERQLRALDMVIAFQYGPEATWRDQVIWLFEEYGMDVCPDGKDW